MKSSLRFSRGLFFTVVLLLSAGLISVAFGGDYHMGATLICSDCHVAHFSLNHNYSGGTPSPLGADGPYEFLLKNDINALCLSCHDDTTSAPDVYGEHNNNYVRQAGALTTGAAPHQDYKGHSLQFLTCITCHDPHGDPGIGHPTGSQYRNLKARPGYVSSNRFVTYAAGSNDLGRDIFERDAGLGQIATHYSQANIDFNEPNSSASAIGRWCQSCHGLFHGSSSTSTMRNQSASSGAGWLRHPTADADIGALGGEWSSLAALNDASRPNRVKVASPTGVWSQPYPLGVTPTCLSCHKAHGNKNPFGLLYMSGTGQITEEGDTGGAQAVDLCRQCHVQ